jgi:hypothetical protein
MTLLDILNEIDVRMSNTFEIAQKIRWLDLAQLKLYKQIGLKKTYTFLTVDDTALYTLPDNIKVENIIDLAVASTTDDDTNYTPYAYQADRPSYSKYSSYYRSDYDGLNQIGLYPVPTTTGLSVKLLYRTKPEKIDGSNLLKIPDIDEDYHEMLILDVIMQIVLSGDNPDIDLYNNYLLQYNAMNKDVKLGEYEKEPEYPRTRDVMIKRSRYSRQKTYYEPV